MQGPADSRHTEPDEPRYEAPAIEAREPLNGPLIGNISGRMLT